MPHAKRKHCLLLATICITGTAGNTAAEVSIEETYSYYKVQGNSTAKLRKSINKKRDRNTGLKGFDASTHWTINWTFKYQPTQTGCRITQATVAVKIEYRLPQWPTRDQSNNLVLIEAWNTYSNNLHNHESAHGNIAKTAANDIEHSLLNINHSDCELLQSQANQIASQLVKESRQQHTDFDTATDHGGNTGAIFP